MSAVSSRQRDGKAKDSTMTYAANNVRHLVGTGGMPAAPPFQVYNERHLERIPHLQCLPREFRHAMGVVARVLPFRVNQYVIDNLIDWDNIPDDPMFQLTFPQPQMLCQEDFSRLARVLERGSAADIDTAVRAIRAGLNPHPAGQRQFNVPRVEGRCVDGLQHKYRETVLFFPAQGQTCHTYCTFCFRWAQFVGDGRWRFSARDGRNLHQYLAAHQEVSDLLVTSGDPMVMRTRHLKAYLLPLLSAEFDHVRHIRIGTKALSYWPYRFLAEEDSDDLMRLLETLVRAGKHVAVMAHYNHWRELEDPAAQAAVARLRRTGAVIRSQGPLLNHVNNHPAIWARLWKTQVRLGIVPYYMFVERDTGARHYFEVPLARAWTVYRDAAREVSGLARTARGPSMSTAPGKVEVQGVARIHGEEVFVLRFIQARDPAWVQRPFFARYDHRAVWLDDLRPWGEERFFFEGGA
jgi:KamA family protein